MGYDFIKTNSINMMSSKSLITFKNDNTIVPLHKTKEMLYGQISQTRHSTIYFYQIQKSMILYQKKLHIFVIISILTITKYVHY